MKQIIQNLKTGVTTLDDVPSPLVKPGHVLIQTTRSLVSLGTERMLVEFGKANLISKARQQPDKVKMVLEKIKSDGLMPTLETVFNKLDQPLPLGYCNVGRVIETGTGVTKFRVGDRVASNGHHAEFVSIPENLVARVPDEVSDDQAAFTVIGSIGLQGIRLLQPNFGETVVVIGLGLIGLITTQLLKSNGCDVIGVDVDQSKLDIAESLGITTINSKQSDPVAAVLNHTGEIGADGVIITASAKTDAIISQAANMSRKRGSIILVGVIGLNISRADFYEKELKFQVSCSYGPGRYDDQYEQRGQDYPLPYVRWTEQRNFQAILKSLATKRLDVDTLISERVALDDFQQIYGSIGSSKSIASIITYREDAKPTSTVNVGSQNTANTAAPSKGSIGIVGAGNFTKMVVLPSLKKCNASIGCIASSGGVSGTALAQKHGIAKSTSDYKEILKDQSVDTVVVTTRHDLHASMTIEAMQAGKNVFVEKPLALNNEELDQIIAAHNDTGQSVMVGFNRRFSPHAEKIKSLLPTETPKNFVATMNAGFIPADVWVHDLQVGGGRIIGEACHYIDLITYLSGSLVEAVCMSALGSNPEENTDNASILLRYRNGDNAVVNYFANGSKAYSKERVEVHTQLRSFVLDNFKLTKAFGVPNFSKLKTRQDKGHDRQFALLKERIQSGGAPLIPFAELVNTTRASFAAIQSLMTGEWVMVNHDDPAAKV